MSLKQLVDDGKTILEDGESKIRTFLDEHVPQLASLAELIEANPIFTSVEGALHVPPEILNGFAKALDAVAATYPKPEPPAAAEVPAQPAPPAEPQPQDVPAALWSPSPPSPARSRLTVPGSMSATAS